MSGDAAVVLVVLVVRPNRARGQVPQFGPALQRRGIRSTEAAVRRLGPTFHRDLLDGPR